MPNPIGPDLFRHLAAVSDPSLAPDGSRVAYTLSWIDPATSESRSRIYRVELPSPASGADNDAAGAPPPDPQPLTDGNADTSPRYSPDGATLALLRPAAGATELPPALDVPRQIWLMPAGGGDARQLTAFPNGVREFAWAPDSRRLAAVADVCPDDGAPQDDAPSVSAPPRVREVRRIRYRHDALGWRGDCHFHIFIVDAATGAAAPLTAGDWDDTAPAWSPAGDRIAFISGRSDTRDIAATGEVYVVPVPDFAADPAAEPPAAELWSDGLSDAVAATWSPDGKCLAAAGSMDDGLMALWQAYWHILEPGQPPRPITDDSIRPCLGYPGIAPQPEARWIADNDGNSDGRILFLADAEGQTRLYMLPVPPAGAPMPSSEALTDGGEQITGIALDAAASSGVIVASPPTAPADLYLVATTPGAAGRCRLTTHNDAWLAEHPSAQMEKFIIERDDFDIECRLIYPPRFDSARKYPLILEIHGGPNGAFYDAFTPLHQVLAGAGYLVLAVNPRGSSTYGAEFVNAVLGDWGGDDYRDLMASLDAVCNRPYVDRERLGVHGYSYGGYMTAWAIGHNSRFRAAVAGAPCIDLWSMYGVSDIATGFGEAQWAVRLAGGMSISRPLVDELAGGVDALVHRLLQRSPINYAPRVQTPVLLLHGETDARCPIGQSEQYFQVLKRLGKEVEMARFPGCGHSFLRTGHIAMRQAYLERMLAWFARWL